MTPRRALSLLLLLLLASCAGSERQRTAPSPSAAAHVCRVGPDGGPVGEAPAPPASRTADRGIGGTGVSTGPALADRGIGGTGIVGVITGFASICVDGLEVGIEPSTPVQVDDSPASAAALRAGQVVIVTAHGPGTMLRASGVAVRYEVSGPVQRIATDGARLTVAGQAVTVPAALRGGAGLKLSGWVSVSGFRASGNEITATRIDARPPGSVSVHGQITESGGGWRIGDLALRFPGAPGVRPGEFVRVSGQLADGALRVGTVSPDVLATDPPAWFGPDVNRLVIQSFTSVSDGRVRLGPAFEADTAAGLAPTDLAPTGLAPAVHVVEFDREPGGRFLATGLRAAAGPGAAMSGPMWTPAGAGPARPNREGFTPAPMPNTARMPFGQPGFAREGMGLRPPLGGGGFGTGGVGPEFGCPSGEACRPGRGPGGPSSGGQPPPGSPGLR